MSFSGRGAKRNLLDEAAFAFEDREAVAVAINLFEAGSRGFADCLVVAKHARQGCERHILGKDKHPAARTGIPCKLLESAESTD